MNMYVVINFTMVMFLRDFDPFASHTHDNWLLRDFGAYEMFYA
jgi:hypothetical protein